MSRPLGELAERLQRVRQQIAAAGGTDVEIVAVTKIIRSRSCEAAAAAGLTAVGENYAQELLAKFGDRCQFDVAVHFIGQLQTNKVRLSSDLVDVYETLDRPSLAAELAKRAPGAQVLVQVDTGARARQGRLCARTTCRVAGDDSDVARADRRRADDGRPDRRRARGGAARVSPRARAVRHARVWRCARWA